eukprot:TRINITY_DN7031_c0_g3_i2.p1 TRINITY_DN7031_c0_g3~~TRINITY_DN7031_c0_g3_i2.p1  ORF type:complete len:309 (-),score=44.16 TRINITY_DN7031_c0_g3_i2:69-995(-)
MSRACQLESICTVTSPHSYRPLDEYEGYEKYGQKKYVRFLLVFVGLFILISATSILFIVEYEKYQIETLNVFTISLSSILLLLILHACFKSLKQINEPLSIFDELLIIILGYFFMQLAYHTIIFMDPDISCGFHSRSQLLGMVLLIRNAVWLLCALIVPFAKYSDELLASYRETKTCAKSLEVVLCSKLGYLYFVSYIEEHHGEGKDIIQLFNLLIIRKEREKERVGRSEIEQIITQLCDTSPVINKLFEDNGYGIEGRNYNKIIPIVMEKLNEYFESFVGSDYHAELQQKLLIKEIVNERLQQADLI